MGDTKPIFTLTKNQHGVEHPLNPIALQFVESCKKHKGNVLDIGAAFGVASIPALKKSKINPN
jgi:hypothetical protein